ncbi:hypothetical protein, partial [Marinobacter sp. UBA5687]|uniref:hypothetical protein n=1 Tax=Marinobacter sp. UBA5687 TaxID=1946823 RepID=UPI00259A47E2
SNPAPATNPEKPAFAGFSHFRGQCFILTLFLARQASFTGLPFLFPLLCDVPGVPSINSDFRLALW